MREKILIIIVLVIVSSGCISLTDEVNDVESEVGSEEAPEFSELVSKAEESEYSVEYTYNLGPAMYDGEPEIHSSNGIRRVMRFGNLPGEGEVIYNAYYGGDEIEFSCTEGMEDTPVCGTPALDAPPTVDYYTRIGDFNVSHIGEDTKIGRDCIKYRISGGDYIDHYVDICLDSEKGFASQVERKTIEGDRTVESLEAVEYSSDVEESVEPLTNAVPSISCMTDEAEIITADFSGDVRVEVNDFETSIEMEEWSSETIDLSGELDEQENRIEVEAEDSVQTDVCYEG